MRRVLFGVPFLILLSGCLSNGVFNGSMECSRLHRKHDVTINGSLKVASLRAENVTVHGSGKLGPDESIVAGDLQVSGSLRATNLIVEGDTNISGSVHVDKATFMKNIAISGKAEMASTTIHGDLFVHGKKLTLRNDVTIKGRIEFMKKAGTVQIDGANIHLLSGIVNGTAKVRETPKSEAPLHF